MNPQFIAKTAITVALVLAASMLSKRPGLLGALVAALPLTSLLVLGWLYAETRDAQRVAAMSMDIFWFVIGGLLFFPVLSFSLKAGWQPWLCFLLAKSADPAIADRQGVTPLMHSALLNFTEGAEELLLSRAPVDQTNRRGETALILAVQAKNVAMVRLLVKNGASPDKADHIAGMSARDYAKRDDRTGQLLSILDAKPDAPGRQLGPTFGPSN